MWKLGGPHDSSKRGNRLFISIGRSHSTPAPGRALEPRRQTQRIIMSETATDKQAL